MKAFKLMIAVAVGLAVAGPAAAYPKAGEDAMACTPVRFAGEVSKGKAFAKPFGPGLVIWLRPETHPANPPGWTLVVHRATDPDETHDYAMVATPPYRFWNPRYLNTGYGWPARDVVSLTPRDFRFVLSEADYNLMRGALGKLLWSGNHTQEEIAQANRIMEEAGKRTARGIFSILDSRLGSAGPEDRAGWIDWMKFEVELCAPEAENRAARDRKLTEQELYPALEEKFLRDTPDPCEVEQKLTITRIQYGELDGRPGEEAVVEALSCLAGTGGIDLYGVWTVADDGSVRELPFKDGSSVRVLDGKGITSGLRGKMSLAIEEGRLVQRFPVYRDEDANCCPSGGERRFIYRFEDGEFVLDKVVDVPPAQE